MSKRDEELLLEDMLDSITKIESYLEDRNFEAFKQDERTIDAVVRNLEIIGEAANHLPDSAKEESKDIRWNRIVGLRNRIIHEYFGVDLNIIWKIVTADLPKLKDELKQLKMKY